MSGRLFTRVTFADKSVQDFARSAEVTVTGPVQVPAGPVAEGWYVRPQPRVRVTDGKWRGEGGSRWDDRIATHAAFAAYAG